MHLKFAFNSMHLKEDILIFNRQCNLQEIGKKFLYTWHAKNKAKNMVWRKLLIDYFALFKGCGLLDLILL